MMPVRIRELQATSISQAGTENHVTIPLYLCSVSAGFPAPGDDYIEREIDLNEWLIRNRVATYIVRVEGDSMSGEIHPGGWLIVDRSLEPRHTDVVIACIDGEMTVKRLMVKEDNRLLVAENPDYPVIELNGDEELIIWGVVTHSIHRLRR
jgi:DNA polymerase V